jgi:hypothetical protein
MSATARAPGASFFHRARSFQVVREGYLFAPQMLSSTLNPKRAKSQQNDETHLKCPRNGDGASVRTARETVGGVTAWSRDNARRRLVAAGPGRT